MFGSKCFFDAPRLLAATVAAIALCGFTLHSQADTSIGPLNPGFENGGQNWTAGGPGGDAGSVSFDNPGTNGPSAPGTNSVLMTSDGSVAPPGGVDLRADYFSLGAAGGGNGSVTVSFDYYIVNPINAGNEVRVGLRFLDAAGGFVGEYNFHIGAPNGDTGGTGWQHFVGTATPIAGSVNADLRLSMNVFGDDIWSSGPVLFDNFSVTVSRQIGPQNPGFEAGGLDWNTGGPGGDAGSVNFLNPGTNGPSAPGTNAVLMTSDGSVSPPNGVDLRANYFSLGAASQGASSLKVEFDYNILNTLAAGNEIRVGLRYLDAGGGFLGEYNFHIGAPSGDVGAAGWRHFVGYATPIATAVTADLRLSMNIFGDDIWSSGPILFDNFSVTVTPVLGPSNPGFENFSQSWNASGNGTAAGAVSFFNPGTNGPSAPGTNSVSETSDGSGNVDFRSDYFSLGNAAAGAQSVTISFDYNILGPVQGSDQIRVGLRYFDAGGGAFQGEFNSYIGAVNGDTGGQGWKHFTATTVPVGTAATADIRVSMNIFGDDTWHSGTVLFDNFSVSTGSGGSPTANDLTFGTITNLPVTELVIGATNGPTDPSGQPLTISAVSQPTNGTATTDGTSITYKPNAGFTGTDQFTYTVSNSSGGTATATITVQVNANAGLNKFTGIHTNTGTNSETLSFSGAPYVNYTLEFTGSLNPPVVWTPQQTNSADASGIVTFTAPQANSTNGFWRTAILP